MITRALFNLSDAGSRIFLAILIAAAVLVPASNLLLPPDHALHVPTHIVSLVGKYLC